MAEKFGVIYCDYPWAYKCWSKAGSAKRSAESHYKTMAPEKAIHLAPFIDRLADDPCAMFFWVTHPTKQQAFEVIKAWGFEYVTVAFTWAKLNKNHAHQSDLDRKFFFGMGYYTRANTEECWLCRRGKLPRFENRSIRQLVLAPIREHSRKPDEVRRRIDLAYPKANKIELFARTVTPGWTSWGLETGKFTTP